VGDESISYSCGVLTVSDKGARGEREDSSGEQIKETLRDQGFEVAAYAIVPDLKEAVRARLVEWTDQLQLDLIVTTGGTGVAPTDVTPEATLSVIDREIPGIGEAMRAASFRMTPHAVLSRSVAGIRKQTLIVNLPGSKKAAYENLQTILLALPHAIYKIKGGMAECGG